MFLLICFLFIPQFLSRYRGYLTVGGGRGDLEILNISHFDSLLGRPGVAPLSQSGPRSGICRLETLRFHVSPYPGSLAPWLPGSLLEFHNLTPLSPLTTPHSPSQPQLQERMLTLVKFPDLVWTSELRRLHHQ